MSQDICVLSANAGSHWVEEPAGSSVSMLTMYPSNPSAKMSKKNLQNALDNYERIVGIALIATNEFSKGDLRNFDPLVGENACQIRAALYSDLACKKGAQEQLQGGITTLEEALQKVRSIRLSDHLMSLDQLLIENGIITEVPEAIHSIFLGYVLTITKNSQTRIENGALSGKVQVLMEEENRPAPLQEKIAAIKHGGANLAKELIKLARKQLSEISISYLRQELAQLPNSSETKRLQEALDETQILSSPTGLRSSRCLPGMEVLMKSLLRKKTPLVLNVKMIHSESGEELGTLSVPYLAGENRYIPTAFVKQMQPSAGVVIDAVSIGNKISSLKELRDRIIHEDISEIILANCAAHPQYGGQNKQIEPPEDAVRASLKARALEKGCCEANPELVRIYHIYVGTISEYYREESNE